MLLFVWEATSNTPQKGRGKQEEKYSQTASCTCFWDCSWRCASHLLANFSLNLNWRPFFLSETFLKHCKVLSTEKYRRYINIYYQYLFLLLILLLLLQCSNNPRIFAKVDSVQFPSFSKVRSSQTPQRRSWKISLHVITFQPTSWCLDVCPWATYSPKTSLSSPTHPLPRLDIQWNLYFTDPILEDGDD